MLTQREINAYHNNGQAQRTVGGAAAWLILYAVAVLGALAAIEQGIQVATIVWPFR
jgi:hypothetical protein